MAGFINPGSRLPPIADPQLHFMFVNSQRISQLDQKLQGEEFIGDRIYGASLLQVLEQWALPRRCISMLFFAFTSNAYQERLFHKWKIPQFLVTQKEQLFIGKPCADALEVSNMDIHLLHFSFALSLSR